MLINYIKIALRNLMKHRVYAGISILGLAVGISSCLLILMYVFDELSYDRYHSNLDRVYRLETKMFFNGEMNTALSNFGCGPTIMQDYPEVKSYVRFRGTGSTVDITVNDKVFNESNIWLVDSTIFEVFDYQIIEGNPDALKAPNSIVLTQTMKEKFFGGALALGEPVKINNTITTVTAVVEDPPGNSDITVGAMLSMNTMPEQARATFMQDWFRIGFYTFLLFERPPDVESFERKLTDFEEKYVQPWAAANEIEAGEEFHLTPLADVHFKQGLEHDMPKGNMDYIVTFALLAVFILLIASINYVNLSLAQSVRRAKEVGVRKTFGSGRGPLLTQFIGESVILTIIAALVGIFVTQLFMSTFNEVTSKSFDLSALLDPVIVFSLIGIVVLVGVLAGSYPAFVLSRFEPAKVLKGDTGGKGGKMYLQKGLIFGQFIFSLFMITGTLLVQDQMDYMRTMNLGFDKEHILSISLPADTNVGKQIPAWADQLRTRPEVLAVANTTVPTGNTGELMFRIEQNGALKEQGIKFFFVDEHFIDVMGLELKMGRNFNREIESDRTQAFLINEYAVDEFGWQDDPIGKRIQWGLQPNNQATNDGVVVGVVNNFHFLSLHNPMEPFVLCFNPSGNNTLSIRLADGDFRPAIEAMESEWGNISATHPFTFNFMDELLDRNYQEERTMGRLFGYFAFIAIVLATLGLFALVSYSIQSRTKEIGIRKVLGASSFNIAWVVLKDYVYLMLAAFVVITPVCVYLMNRWLENFAYTVELQPLTFVLALLLLGAMALLSVVYHIVRISRTDPIVALRYE